MAPLILNAGATRNWVIKFRDPAALLSVKEASDTHWKGRWVGSRAGLDVGKLWATIRRFLNPERSHYTDWVIDSSCVSNTATFHNESK
jgi:hypothetical protein